MDTKWRKSEEARPEEEMDTLGIYNGIAEDGHTGEHTNEHTDELCPNLRRNPALRLWRQTKGRKTLSLD